MKNSTYVIKELDRKLKIIKKRNMDEYEKIEKKISFLQNTNIDRLLKKSSVKKVEVEKYDMYLCMIDKISGLIFVLIDKKIFIFDYIKLKGNKLKSVLLGVKTIDEEPQNDDGRFAGVLME